MKPIYSVITMVLALMATSVCFAAPTLGTPATANVGANLATLVLQSGETGTGYFTLLSGSNTDCGSGTQVKTGQTASGAAAPYFGTLPLTAATNGSYTLRNLSHNSPYTVCFTADSPSGSNLNPTPAAASFATSPATAFTSPGWSAVGSAGFSAGTATSISLAFEPDGTPYVAYQDGGNGGKATVMNYSADPWAVAGSAGFSVGIASSASLAFAPDGTPYVAYGGDDYNISSVAVMMFDGNDWIPVGSASLPVDPVGYTSLAIAPDGVPHVAYADYSLASGGKVTVLKFSDGAWGTVGNAGFTAFDAAFVSLAIAPDGTLYVAYQDGGNAAKATVMKYSGGVWNLVGNAGFSASAANSTSLAISPNGTPYVAFRDDGNSSGATVMQYSAGVWTNVGSAGFSAGGADFTSLAIAPDGVPYVVYQDWANGYKATVMKYSAGSWSVVAGAGLSANSTSSLSLVFAPDGTPYVAYGDDGNSSRATVMKLVNLSPTISGVPVTIATVGTEYSFTPTATHADSFSYSGTLPPGLSFSTATGTLSGTPTAGGIYPDIVITANNTFGADSLPPFSVEVFNFPDTLITSFPGSSSASFSFTFMSAPSGATFECSLNGGGYAACPTPYSNGIAPCATCRPDTVMTFAVKARNPAGNYDPTPATCAWTINQTIEDLFANVSNGGEIQLPAADFTGDVNAIRGVAFTLKGGYDAGYSTNGGLTNIHGTVTVSAGTVTVENVVIM